jgi:uncharacterized membrane protein
MTIDSQAGSTNDETDDPVVFEAMVTPYRSLSPGGLRVLIGFVCGVSLCTTTLFWWLGAWPIAGFNGAEILLAVLLLRLHAKSSRRCELLMLSGAALRILRIDSDGRSTELSLRPGWLNVRLQERPGRVPGLYLSAHGQHVEVAASLGEPEKRDLAEALSAALHRLKNPVFDNPQLRPEMPQAFPV